MNFYDYIKIKGLDETPPDNIDPAQFEIFVGIGAELMEQQTINLETGLMPIAPATPIDQTLWIGQQKLINYEAMYVKGLNELFKRQQQKMPNSTLIGQVVEEVGEMLEELLASILGGFVTRVVGAVGTPVETAVFVISKFVFECLLGYAWDKLSMLWSKGIDLCNGIEEEDFEMLKLLPSMEIYNLRKDNLRLHQEMIKNIIAQIEAMQLMMDKAIAQTTDTKGIVKALKPIENIDQSINKLEILSSIFQTIQGNIEDMNTSLKDLSLVDATIEAGNDLKVRVKGKALEF